MPQVLRWPEYRTEPVPRKIEKILQLVYLVDNPSISQRGLTEKALEAFTESMKKYEMRALLMALIEKDKLFAKRQKMLEGTQTPKGLEFN
jgi:hypothetical protein